MTEHGTGVAIVGMACRFPGAPNLAAFRSNLMRGVDAISDLPAGRWDPVFFDPTSNAPDRIYCRRGGFIGDSIAFDPVAFGIMPMAAEGAEPEQMLALQLVRDALRDAGLDPESDLPRQTTSVILGRGGYPGVRMMAGIQHVRTAQQLVEALKAIVPDVPADRIEAVKQEFVSQLGHYGGDTAIGLVPNITASRIANRFDFGGSAFTVDAACASALIAVDLGVRELQSGTADVVVTGGVHLCDDLNLWNVFSRLGALSRAQMTRPFDRRSDGLLMGEGIGILVLKRLADAERDGNRIYAVIRGTGTASDGREKSLMSPSVDGQILALDRAWKRAGLEPGDIGLLEAHGTGTPQGDRTELETITRFFRAHLRHTPGIGSVKSMIGHTMPAAGAAGMIKAALALHHRFLPPTLHCEQPHELLGPSGFEVIRQSESWDPEQRPLVAAVNAFGFGGINAHVVLEAGGASARAPFRSRVPASAPGSTLFFAAADSTDALAARVAAGTADPAGGAYRVVIENPTAKRRELAREIIHRGTRWSGRNGIWFSPGGLARQGGRIAFLYPGVHGRFGTRLDTAAAFFGRDLPAYHDAAEDLVAISTGIISLGRWLTEILQEIGVNPDVLAGHSIGEWTAMVVAGVTSASEADRFVDDIVPTLRIEVPGVVFAAAGCGVAQGSRAIDGLPDIGVSHDNCPHQIILCGAERSIDAALSRLRSEGVLVEKLPFRSGFHSPLFRPYLSALHEKFGHFALSAPRIPLWSATTVDRYPAEHDRLQELCFRHLIEPVAFRALTERLYAEGVRVFVQVGVGPLEGFVGDTLRGRAHAALSAHVEQRDGLEQLRRVAAELWCEGYDVAIDRLGLGPAAGASTAATGSELQLPLSLPLVRFKTRLERTASLPGRSDAAERRVPDLPPGPVRDAFAAVHDELLSTSGEVLDAWRRAAWPERQLAAGAEARSLQPRRLARTVRYSLAEMPELIDHSFIEQPPDWPVPADCFPVVPMTRSLGHLAEFAREVVPEMVPVAIERVRALRWIEVEPPIELEVVAEFDGVNKVQVTIGDRLSGTVLMAPAYASPPVPTPFDPGVVEMERMGPERFYGNPDVFVFHGPSYQSVVGFGPMGSKGLRGEVECLPAPGSLLDAAGQLLGYWSQAHTAENRVVLPFRVDRIEFFGPHPVPGRRLLCDVRVLELTDVWIRGDLEMHDGEHVWARISGWEDRRFESDARLHDVFIIPANSAFATVTRSGYCVAEEKWRSTASRYFIARRYLDREDMAAYAEKGVRAQRAWLLGRVAAKDAVRQFLWQRGHGPIYPIEVKVENTGSGRPRVKGPWSRDLRVSIAHKEDRGVALVGEGVDVGIDIETIEARSEEFARIICADAELALLPEGSRDEWLTRVWVAKEAVAKALGTGLAGDARRFPLRAVAGERLLVRDHWVETCREGAYIVGWTQVSDADRTVAILRQPQMREDA